MKLTHEQLEELKALCIAGNMTNAELAVHFRVPVNEIYALRSRYKITIPACKALGGKEKQAERTKRAASAPADAPKSKINKAAFVSMLELVLRHACNDVVAVELVNQDTVAVEFTSGFRRLVNIECDSRLAIIKDVVRAVE